MQILSLMFGRGLEAGKYAPQTYLEASGSGLVDKSTANWNAVSMEESVKGMLTLIDGASLEKTGTFINVDGAVVPVCAPY